jgi:hypothetical protein
MKTSSLKTQSRFSHCVRGERGFGLIVLVMSFGLFTLLALGSSLTQSEYSYTRLKISRTKKADMQSLKYEMNFILGSRDGCIENLKTFSILDTHDKDNPISLNTIKFGNVGSAIDPLVSLDVPKLARYGRVPVKKISLSAHPEKFGPSGAGTHLTLLNVEIGTMGIADGQEVKNLFLNHSFEIPVYVTTDAGGVIKNCHSTQFSGKDAAGKDLTLEEKLCNDAIQGKTANWPADCLTCLNDSVPYHLCLPCKAIGKKYDPATKECA